MYCNLIELHVTVSKTLLSLTAKAKGRVPKKNGVTMFVTS